MNVIALGDLREFWVRHPEAEVALREWYRLTRKVEPGNFAQRRDGFSSAEYVRTREGAELTIFGVGGNKYRVVASIRYGGRTAYIKRVFTHAEYDAWNRAGRKV